MNFDDTLVAITTVLADARESKSKVIKALAISGLVGCLVVLFVRTAIAVMLDESNFVGKKEAKDD